MLKKPMTWIALAVVVAGLVVGLALFEPWRVFTSSHLDEPVPVVATAPGTATTTSEAQPVVLAEGSFVSQEHPTMGAARVLELADGSRLLRLEGFSTSDGPDVHVWLSDATAGGDLSSYDDGHYVPLGEIKATDGNHNYVIPEDADLTGLRSAVIWCDRFNVAFGSAALAL